LEATGDNMVVNKLGVFGVPPRETPLSGIAELRGSHDPGVGCAEGMAVVAAAEEDGEVDKKFLEYVVDVEVADEG
jgi:hypothetical protein